MNDQEEDVVCFPNKRVDESSICFAGVGLGYNIFAR
jgi:hypothetical protein